MYAGAATIGVEEKARARGIPMAVGLSLALHGLGLVGFMRMSLAPAEEPLTVIDNVDLMVQEEEKKAEPARPKVPPPSMKDFLKLALPSVPKPAAPMEVKAPEEEKRLLDMTPKLEDRGRVKEPQKLEALDLDRRRPDLAKLSAAPLEERPSRTLEALPKLEEVGTRQAPRKALQLAQLAEDRGRVQMQRMDALGSLAPERRRAPASAPMLDAEAATGRSPSMSRLADMLTSQKLEQPRGELRAAAPTQPRISAMTETPAPPPARKAEVREVKKKAVEIEGPLSNRRVVQHSIPSFPDWARELGLVEAEVQIRFYVAADGAVLPDNMRVERTAGYGRLDRLAMQHLKAWRFEPKPGAGNEWGLITFRFLLE